MRMVPGNTIRMLVVLAGVAGPALALAGERCINLRTNCPGKGWVTSSCDDPDPCGFGSGGNASGASDAAATGAAIGQALGNAIVDGIRESKERARQQAALRAIQAAEFARQQAMEEEARKARLLGEMLDVDGTSTAVDDGSGDGLGLMLDDDPVARSSGSAFMPVHNERPKINPQPGAVLRQPAAPPGLADELMLGDEPVPVVEEPVVEEPAAADPTQDDAAFNKGFVDASGCYSSSAGNFCAAAQGDIHAVCINSYEAGYRRGASIRDALLAQAHQAGVLDRQQARRNGSFTHPQAQGSCRLQWIESYNGGFNGLPMPRMGR